MQTEKFPSVQTPGRAPYWQAACVSVGLVSSEGDCLSHRGSVDFMTEPNELQGLDSPSAFKAGWVPGKTCVVEVMGKAMGPPSLGTHPGSHKTKSFLN